MANYKIYPLNLGKLIRNNAETPIVAFYLTDGVNKVIVDTGGVPADGKKFMPYFQEPGQRIEEALANLGVGSCRDQHCNQYALSLGSYVK